MFFSKTSQTQFSTKDDIQPQALELFLNMILQAQNVLTCV